MMPNDPRPRRQSLRLPAYDYLRRPIRDRLWSSAVRDELRLCAHHREQRAMQAFQAIRAEAELYLSNTPRVPPVKIAPCDRLWSGAVRDELPGWVGRIRTPICHFE